MKAATNFFAGTLSDRYGRKPVLVAGWLIGLPVPLLLMWAPSWGWVIAANVLLGVNQGLTWSTTVIMKIDLVGPERRGSPWGSTRPPATAPSPLTALATGYIAEHAGLRPEPFYLGLAFAALGLGLSTLFVRETHGHARHEAPPHVARTTATTHGSAPARCSASPASGEGAVVVQPGRAGQQPQRRPRLGPVPDLLRRRRAERRAHRRARRALPRGVGPRPARHRRAVRSDRPQAAHRRRDAHPGRRHRLDRRHHGFGPGRSVPSSSAPAPRWCTRRCSPPSATSPTPAGGPDPSASTGSGATAAPPGALLAGSSQPISSTAPSGRPPPTRLSGSGSAWKPTQDRPPPATRAPGPGRSERGPRRITPTPPRREVSKAHHPLYGGGGKHQNRKRIEFIARGGFPW